LANACRFVATFAQLVFGGRLAGNWYHVWCEADTGRIDLTDAVQFEAGIPADMSERARGVGLDVDDATEHDPRVWPSRN
jgi:hypothetical protein